jgi:hypothetical protein
MYLTSSSSTLVGRHKKIGCIQGPRVGVQLGVNEGRAWAGDNDVYSGNYDEAKFLEFLERMTPHAERCLFIAAPDVMSDAPATLARFPHWQEVIGLFGFKAALVLQDGMEALTLPDCEAVFVGGSTEWKLSDAATTLMRQARERGAWVHVGRVNSLKRCLWAHHYGADSVDGTHTTYYGDFGLKNIEWWLTEVEHREKGARLWAA